MRYLASTILSLCARQLPGDGERLYGYRPAAFETPVDAQFRGASYKAANLIYMGETRGRGRMDQHHEFHDRAVKRIYVSLSVGTRSGAHKKIQRRAGFRGTSLMVIGCTSQQADH